MKAKKTLFLIAALLLGNLLSAQIEPTWESINQRGYPQWFSDAKLGIFIHWGVYSVPAYASLEGYAEWYYRGLTTSDERKTFQERVYGKDFRYENFAPMWKAELWNPDEWAELFWSPNTPTASASGRANMHQNGTPWRWGPTATSAAS